MQEQSLRIAFASLALAAIVGMYLAFALRRWHKHRFVPRIRHYVEPPTTKPEYTSALWFCPQCYLTTGKPGTCPNEGHEHARVQLEPGDPNSLEYYHEMQNLINSEIDD